MTTRQRYLPPVLKNIKFPVIGSPLFIISNPNAAFAGSVPYLMLAGNVVAGWQLARALLVAEDQLAAGTDAAFMQAKITTARFYADHILSRAPGVRDSVVDGADAVTAMAVDAF